MIIEGFEIENWSCIKKLTLAGLPATGVIVLHGPNRTGKSSLVQALRACLMDYPSTTAALKSSYPRGSGEKPTVSVTFNAGGTTYRIRKCFGSNKSELASRTSAGAWRVETTTAAEAHSQVCDRVGGGDLTKGLRSFSGSPRPISGCPIPKSSMLASRLSFVASWASCKLHWTTGSSTRQETLECVAQRSAQGWERAIR